MALKADNFIRFLMLPIIMHEPSEHIEMYTALTYFIGSLINCTIAWDINRGK